MSRRFLAISVLVAAIALVAGLLALDVPIVFAVHASEFENLPLFVDGLHLLDSAFGMRVSYWLAPGVCLTLGLVALRLARANRLSQVLATAIVSAGLVQAATIGAMMLGKNAFGRLRPVQLLESGDWSLIWFAGGGSFPSGHSAFYFGLFLPLAASAPRVWQRAVLLTIPFFAIAARIDMSKHFLSDVSASALIAACLALLAASCLPRSAPSR